MFSALIVIVGASTGFYALASSAPIFPAQVHIPIHAGKSIHITGLDRQLTGGTSRPMKYLGEAIPFTLSRTGTLTGSWDSTGESVVYVTGLNWVWMELPMPYEHSGSLNQTLPAGQYSLIYGGYAGDIIFVRSTIGISYQTPHSISSLRIPEGAVIQTNDSSVSFSFSLSEPGTIVGSFLTSGPFSFSVSITAPGTSNVEGLSCGFSFGDMNSSAGVTDSGPLTTPLEPGSYTLTFSGSNEFVITGTIEVLNIIEWNNAA